MHVAINASFWGQETTGTGQYLHRLIAELAATPGVELSSLAARALTTASGPGIRRLSTPVDLLGVDIAKLWFEQVTFARESRRLGCDVAHVPYFAPPLHHRVPVVVTIHDLIPMLLPAYRGSRAVRLYTSLVARAAARADLIITDSTASARDILRLLRIGQERLRVIPLAAGEQYHPLPEAEITPVLARHGLEPPYILYLGGFDVRKNVPLLIKAFRGVAACSDVTLVIAGRLPDRPSDFAPDPRPLVQQLGLSGRVRFLGLVAEDDKPALYGGALAFVFPSQYEGFGLPVLEAIACGTPAVVTSGSSMDEVAGPGGLRVLHDRADLLAAALLRLINEPGLRQELREAGLAHASRFSWRRVAQETLEAYADASRQSRA
ncbi:MAG: glycosyltransferase family 4 protein [Anaerolineae bacterium]